MPPRLSFTRQRRSYAIHKSSSVQAGTGKHFKSMLVPGKHRSSCHKAFSSISVALACRSDGMTVANVSVMAMCPIEVERLVVVVEAGMEGC